MQSLFDTDEFKGYSAQWHSRQAELARRKGYYDGSVYRNVRMTVGPLAPRLYKGIKSLYLPLSRAVDVDAGIIPGHWAWEEDAPDTWEEARKQVFAWSNWITQGVLYCHYGAVFGLSGLKVADVRDLGQVQVIPCSPEYFMLVETDRYNRTPMLGFWLEHVQGPDGKQEYAEVITPQEIRTFIDGKPASIDGRPERYPNALGFVPMVEVKHKETGDPLGECTYQMAIPLLDEVNELASYLADVIKKNVEPQWVISGAEGTDLVKSGDNVWFLPNPQAKAMPLVGNVDIAGVAEFIDRIAANVNGALPELAYDELKQKAQIATATIELQLGELVLKIKRCRPNYDQGLIEALRMAGRAAATMGLGDVAVLDDEALALDDDRPVLPVNPLDQIALESARLGLEMQKSMSEGDGLMGASASSATGQRDRSLDSGGNDGNGIQS